MAAIDVRRQGEVDLYWQTGAMLFAILPRPRIDPISNSKFKVVPRIRNSTVGSCEWVRNAHIELIIGIYCANAILAFIASIASAAVVIVFCIVCLVCEAVRQFERLTVSHTVSRTQCAGIRSHVCRFLFFPNAIGASVAAYRFPAVNFNFYLFLLSSECLLDRKSP